MTRRVAVIGGAASPNGKLQTAADAPLQALEHEILAPLVIDAMAAAGLPKEEIGALVFTMCRPYTLQKYFATFMANYLRLPLKGTIMEVLGNGMTGGMAFDQAVNTVALGHADVALALGINMESQAASADHAMSTMRATGDVDFHTIFGFTPIAWYAMDAVRYMHEHGATRAELASVAVKDRRHASLNPIAQFRKPLTLEEVLAARPIVEPLGLYEVPPRGDGAVCLVVCTEDVARSTGRPYALVRGRGFFHEGAHQINEVPNDMTAFVAAQGAAAAAYGWHHVGRSRSRGALCALHHRTGPRRRGVGVDAARKGRRAGCRRRDRARWSHSDLHLGRVPVARPSRVRHGTADDVRAVGAAHPSRRRAAGSQCPPRRRQLRARQLQCRAHSHSRGRGMSLAFIDVPAARPWPPRVSVFTKPFWDALAEGRLLTTRGRTSGRLTFPPKPFCPYDWGREVEWVELSGQGKLYSQTVIHAAPAAFAREAPIRNGIVTLEEGLRVAARILGEPALDVAMECVVLRYADGPLFAFRAVQP